MGTKKDLVKQDLLYSNTFKSAKMSPKI